jgi:hypothetical protein
MQNDNLKRRNTMATASELLYQTWLFNITVQGGASLPDEKIANGDWIEFQNNAPFPVSITFTTSSGTVFSNIPNIPSGGRSTPQQAQLSNVTVDYVITDLNNNQSQGPYGIQVGPGTVANPAPLLIPITNANPPANEVTISVPLGGWIKFNCDQTYTITWTPVSPKPFNTPASLPQGLSGAYQASGNVAMVATYSLNSGGIEGVQGGGTVRVGS